MSEKPAWKEALQEANALGWFVFLMLVVAVVFSAIYFGSNEQEVAEINSTVTN